MCLCVLCAVCVCTVCTCICTVLRMYSMYMHMYRLTYVQYVHAYVPSYVQYVHAYVPSYVCTVCTCICTVLRMYSIMWQSLQCLRMFVRTTVCCFCSTACSRSFPTCAHLLLVLEAVVVLHTYVRTYVHTCNHRTGIGWLYRDKHVQQKYGRGSNKWWVAWHSLTLCFLSWCRRGWRPKSPWMHLAPQMVLWTAYGGQPKKKKQSQTVTWRSALGTCSPPC